MNKAVLATAFGLMLSVSTMATLATAGSVGHGDFGVYKGGQLADKLSGQNPIDEGALLVCDGKCMIKSEGVSLVAGSCNAGGVVTGVAATGAGAAGV